MGARVLVVLACLVAVMAAPAIEIRSPVEPAPAPIGERGCVAHVVGETGEVQELDPATLDVHGAAVAIPAPRDVREARLSGGNWAYATAIQVFEQRGTLASVTEYAAAREEWYVSLAAPSLPRLPDCDPTDPHGDAIYALLATGGRPTIVPGTGWPAPGPEEPNVFAVALSWDGIEQWRASIPARAGYYFSSAAALRPAVALSADRRTLAIIHSELGGADQLSLVDIPTHAVRTQPLREDRATLRLGAVADAKMLERHKAWSPRFVDDRFLYAVVHETTTDELGYLSVLLIDTADARVAARWPERGVMNTVRATLTDFTTAGDSVYVTTRDWSDRPYTLYRLDARDLRPLAKRSYEVFPLIRPLPRS
jgi:hypothetical protein